MTNHANPFINSIVLHEVTDSLGTVAAMARVSGQTYAKVAWHARPGTTWVDIRSIRVA